MYALCAHSTSPRGRRLLPAYTATLPGGVSQRSEVELNSNLDLKSMESHL